MANNILLDTHIDHIMQVFDSKADVEHSTNSVPFEKVVAGEYNLSVSSYVEAKDNREVVDIAQPNAELETTVAKIDRLRSGIGAVVAQIEGEEARGLAGNPTRWHRPRKDMPLGWASRYSGFTAPSSAQPWP